jgi:hypothetical protein
MFLAKKLFFTQVSAYLQPQSSFFKSVNNQEQEFITFIQDKFKVTFAISLLVIFLSRL